MNVTCPNCATVFRVDPAKVPEAGVRARCSICSAVFGVHRAGGRPEPSEPPASTGRESSARAERPVASGPTQPQAAPLPPPAPPAGAAGPRFQASPEPYPPASPVAPPTTGGAATRPAPVAPARAAPPVTAPAGPRGEPARPVAPAAPPRPSMPPSVAGAPAAAPSPAVPAGGAAPSPSAAHPPAPPAPPRPAAPVAGRPVNPFLSQDPALKARRLARALVSDIVVYHPAKRQEGLRDGTLKELFEEEIRKSYEEFTDQVGRELAESSGYFREALNEILAGGRQIF
jgi:predicted Zn finger-like uncharacterized protein